MRKVNGYCITLLATGVTYSDIQMAQATVLMIRARAKLRVMDSTVTANNGDLRTGCSVLASGIYRVLHPQHRLPQEVTLVRNQIFPRCSRCKEPVLYEFVRAAPAIASSHPSTFSVALYELPELASDEPLAG
jgi:hypothetical protein